MTVTDMIDLSITSHQKEVKGVYDEKGKYLSIN